MRSMTGYGRGECARDGFKVTVELNSVNRRQSDITVNLDKELIELEPRIRDVINAALSRGRVNAVVACHRAAAPATDQVALDEPLARAYYRAIRKLQRQLKLRGSVTIELLLRAPGVMKLAEQAFPVETVWPCVHEALQAALAQLIKMREKEGRHLAADLTARLDALAAGVERIRALAPETLKRYRAALHARVKEAGLELSLDDERLMKEVVIFADRCDITEELTRLDSHLHQFRDNLTSRAPVGRTLDFLAQEMNREINTIGSKANAVEISQIVVQMKAELEKIREQVQNIE